MADLRNQLLMNWRGGPLTPNFKKEYMAVAMDDSIPPEDKRRIYKGEFRSLDHYRKVKAKEQSEHQSNLKKLSNKEPFVYPELTKEELEGSTIFYQPIPND